MNLAIQGNYGSSTELLPCATVALRSNGSQEYREIPDRSEM